MKFLKSTMAIVALLAIGSANAKVMKKSTTTTTPITQPIVTQPKVGPTAKTPIFYDEQTAMIKQDYLNKKATEALKSKRTDYQAKLLLNGQFIHPMINEWKRRNFKDIKSMETVLKEQITNAIAEAKENPIPVITQPYEEMSEEEMRIRRG